MKAFTVHATNSERNGRDRLHTLHTDVPCHPTWRCKCTLVRDARRAVPLRTTGYRRRHLSFTSHLFGNPNPRAKIPFDFSHPGEIEITESAFSYPITLHFLPLFFSHFFFLFSPWLSYLLNVRPFSAIVVLQTIHARVSTIFLLARKIRSITFSEGNGDAARDTLASLFLMRPVVTC